MTPDAGELGRQRRLGPRHGDEAHRGEVVDLVGLGGAQRVDERALVEQVALVQRDPVADVLDAVELLGRGAADHAVDVVALLEQQLGEVGAVLAGDAGDQCAGHERASDRMTGWLGGQASWCATRRRQACQIVPVGPSGHASAYTPPHDGGHHGPRLRRPAARGRVRRGGPRGRRASTSTRARSRRSRRGESYIEDIASERAARPSPSASTRRRARRTSRVATRCSSACRRR